jgi:hypothetical protein
MKIHSRLTVQSAELLINYYAEEHLCYHTNVDCLSNLDDLITFFVVDQAWPASTRSIAINTVRNCLASLRVGHSLHFLSQYIDQVLRCARSEKEVTVLESLAEFTVYVAAIADDELFELVIRALRTVLSKKDMFPRYRSGVSDHLPHRLRIQRRRKKRYRLNRQQM